MMRKWVFVLFFIVCLTLPTSIAYANSEFTVEDTEVSYIKKVNGKKCIDLETVYNEINNTSEAITQRQNSIEANKRAGLVSNLTSILSLLGGDGMFCAKDEKSLAQLNQTNPQGFFGYIYQANVSLMASYPDMNVTNHLAQTFVPGYGSNNSVNAEAKEESCDEVGYFCRDACREVRNVDGCYDKCKSDCNGTFSDGRTYWTLYNAFNGLADSNRADAFNVNIEEGGNSWWNGLRQFLKMIFDSDPNSVEDALMEKLDTVDTATETEIEESWQPVYGKESRNGYDFLVFFNIDQMWNNTRNIAYVLYVALLIVIGFMIMFRNKIGGQVMVNVANSIPNIIIGLILVTFSFAIAGLVLDLGKVLINVSATFFQDDKDFSVQHIGGIAEMTDNALRATNEDANIVAQVARMFKGGEKFTGWVQKIFNLGNGLSGEIIKISVLATGSAIIQAILDVDLTSAGAGLGLLAELPLDVTLASVGKIPVLLFLIREVLVLLVCIYASFKVFITMLMTYIKIFITVVLSPFQILIGSFPGNFHMTINWLKSLFAHMLVFVGIFIVINFFTYFAASLDGDAKISQLNFYGNSGMIWPAFIVNLKGVVLIAGYLFAANLPGVINGFLKVGESKEISAAGEATKKALGKMPLIGGMFG